MIDFFEKSRAGALRALLENSSGRFGAFTIVEFLIVITIVSVLSGAIFLDFRRANQRQAVSLVTDQSLLMVQQAQAEVAAGKSEDGRLICEGAYFEVGSVPQKAKAAFDQNCFDFIARDFGFEADGGVVDSIVIGGTSLEHVWIYFLPPDGRITFYDSTRDRYAGEAVITFAHENNDKHQLELRISQLTDQVYVEQKGQ